MFAAPYVDADEWRDQPVRHRFVQGGMQDTAARFAMYFPPRQAYRGRFFQPVLDEAMSAGCSVSYALDSGAYLVHASLGHDVPRDLTRVSHRLAVAVAEYSRALAAEMYGAHRPFGYLYGGAGGACATIGAMESTRGIWEGAVLLALDCERHAEATHSGKFAGKMIMITSLLDVPDCFRDADSYRSRARRALGVKFDACHRWYLLEHCGARAIDCVGVSEQALRDLSAWVEEGTAPPANTSYDIVAGRVRVSAQAAQRKGIQPVVALTANGDAVVEVAVGEVVELMATIDTPPHAGPIVAVEWDIEGAGTFGRAAQLQDTTHDHAVVHVAHVFARPGTYSPCLRATAQRRGDPSTPYARVQNLGWARVVVRPR